MPRYAVLLFDGFSNFVLSSLIEPLRAVHDHGYPELSWCTVTADDGPVRSSSGLRVLPDMPLAELGAPDARHTLTLSRQLFRHTNWLNCGVDLSPRAMVVCIQ